MGGGGLNEKKGAKRQKTRSKGGGIRTRGEEGIAPLAFAQWRGKKKTRIPGIY